MDSWQHPTIHGRQPTPSPHVCSLMQRLCKNCRYKNWPWREMPYRWGSCCC